MGAADRRHVSSYLHGVPGDDMCSILRQELYLILRKPNSTLGGDTYTHRSTEWHVPIILLGGAGATFEPPNHCLEDPAAGCFAGRLTDLIVTPLSFPASDARTRQVQGRPGKPRKRSGRDKLNLRWAVRGGGDASLCSCRQLYVSRMLGQELMPN
jgi:hypothetical protein